MRNRKEDREGFASGVMAGAGLLYLLDPDKCGRRRRVLARDKLVRAEHISSHFIDKAVRDLQNRIHGMLAETWAKIR